MMSTISGAVGGAGSGAWAGLQSSRASAMKDKLFTKVDSDGGGSVDKAELQGMLDHIASKTGQAAGSADDMLGKLDSDGNGSLNKDELDAAMKSLMPAPSSTMEFAGRRGGGEGGGPPSAEGLFSKLDADGSGSLSTEELQPLLDRIAADSGAAAAGDGASAIAASADSSVFSALDTDGDGGLSESEFKTALQGSSDSVSSSAGRPAPPAGGRPPGGPPPGGGPGGASSTGSTEATDPLDTNGDGVVSAQEKAAGEIGDLLKTLASAIDSNGDKSISDGELDSFRSTLNAALQSGSASSSSSSPSSEGGGRREAFGGISSLASLVNKAYADAAANYAQAATGVSLAA